MTIVMQEAIQETVSRIVNCRSAGKVNSKSKNRRIVDKNVRGKKDGNDAKI